MVGPELIYGRYTVLNGKYDEPGPFGYVAQSTERDYTRFAFNDDRTHLFGFLSKWIDRHHPVADFETNKSPSFGISRQQLDRKYPIFHVSLDTFDVVVVLYQ